MLEAILAKIYETVREVPFEGYIVILVVSFILVYLGRQGKRWPVPQRALKRDTLTLMNLSKWLLRIFGAIAAFVGAVGGTINILVYVGWLPSTLEAAEERRAVDTGLRTGRPCLSITSPKDRTRVRSIEIVSGISNSKEGPIWVVVEPLVTNSFWVQGKFLADSDGQWSTTAQFGERVPEHVGQEFVFRAILEPRISLRKGQVLSDWPEARCQSPIVRVTRE